MLVPARMKPGTTTVLSGSATKLSVSEVPYCRGPGNGLRNSVVFAVVCAAVVRFFPFKQFRNAVVGRIPVLRTIAESDLVADLFAGDSFSDIYGLRRFLFEAIPRWCVVLLQRPYVLLPQTYGPFKAAASEFVARSLLKRADIVFTRTLRDDALEALRIGNGVITMYSPDVACVLDADPAPAVLVRCEGSRDCSGNELPTDRLFTVGINISGLMYNGGYNRRDMFELTLDYGSFLTGLIDWLLTIEAVRIVLIPHTYELHNLDNVENDLGACLRVAAKFDFRRDARLKVIDQDLNQHEIKGVISGCDFFIGSRFHACVAALSQGIVTVGVGYSKKFAEGFASFGVPELVVDARTVDVDAAIELIRGILEFRSIYQERVREGAAQVQTTAREAFALLGDRISEICESGNKTPVKGSNSKRTAVCLKT